MKIFLSSQNFALINFNRSVHFLRSQLFAPSFLQPNKEKQTEKNTKNVNKSVSCTILESNGFISDTGAGLITHLPLGKRVLNKLTDLIREEMNRINGQEIEMPSLSDLSLWSKTGRAELIGTELFKLTDRKEKQLCLCPTHEEIVTSLVSKFSLNLPATNLGESQSLRLYQITRKYRDESRPKHGLLRAREFLMKDMYTFHLSEKCVEKTYSDVCKAYETIFDRLDVPYLKTSASVGAMGGSKSHEYHVKSEIGEDRVFTCPNCKKSISADLVTESNSDKIELNKLCELLKCGNECRTSNKIIESQNCIEVGHTFILGDRYTKYFPIKSGKDVVMGCYGIGVSRLMQACVESRQVDGRFPDWPLEIAPFKVMILPAKSGSKSEEKSRKMTNYLIEMLQGNYLFKDDVLVDDRDWMSIGSRLIDAKLIGAPFVIVLGKSIENEEVEIVLNSKSAEKMMGKERVFCHSRETAHVLKQLINDYHYLNKQKKLANFFKFE